MKTRMLMSSAVVLVGAVAALLFAGGAQNAAAQEKAKAIGKPDSHANEARSGDADHERGALVIRDVESPTRRTVVLRQRAIDPRGARYAINGVRGRAADSSLSH
jgi:hypothetical protein